MICREALDIYSKDLQMEFVDVKSRNQSANKRVNSSERAKPSNIFAKKSTEIFGNKKKRNLFGSESGIQQHEDEDYGIPEESYEINGIFNNVHIKGINSKS